MTSHGLPYFPLGFASLHAEVDIPVAVWRDLLREGYVWTFNRSRQTGDTYRVSLAMQRLRPDDDSSLELRVENDLASVKVFDRLLENVQEPYRQRLAPMFEWLSKMKQGENH